MEAFLGRKMPETTLEKNGANTLGKQVGQKRANKSWQTLGNPFLEVLPKPSTLR